MILHLCDDEPCFLSYHTVHHHHTFEQQSLQFFNCLLFLAHCCMYCFLKYQPLVYFPFLHLFTFVVVLSSLIFSERELFCDYYCFSGLLVLYFSLCHLL